MSIRSSGKLKFSEIENEFGRNSKRSLDEYRIKQTVGEMENLPLDENIPLKVRQQVLVSPQLLTIILP